MSSASTASAVGAAAAVASPTAASSPAAAVAAVSPTASSAASAAAAASPSAVASASAVAAASSPRAAASSSASSAADAAALPSSAQENPVPATAAQHSSSPSPSLDGLDGLIPGEKSGSLLSLLGLTGAPTMPATPTPPPSIPFDGGLYTGAVRNDVPHGRGKLKLPSGVEVSGDWVDGVLNVGVLTNPSVSDALHYEGELHHYARHGRGMEWRLEDGEINRWGRWENNILVAECPVPRAVITEGAFLAQEDMLSKLEFILADGTAARYEGERNEKGEPHGVGNMINARGEYVRGPNWLDGAQEGEGSFLHIDGEKYVGSFKNGFKHGYGSHLFPDGELYEGQFRLNRKHGPGKQRWDDGYIYEGLWAHDEQNGWGIEYTKSGKISACGRWKDSELKEWHAVPRSVIPVGTYLNEKAKSADLLYSDGGYYKGEVNAQHEAHGKGILYTASNSIVQGGLFQHGKLHGEGFTNHPDGGRYSGEHRAGLREGFGKLSLANGDKYVGAFHANLQHGRGVYTWAKGDVYDGMWCLEYGTPILLSDRSQAPVLVEELGPDDVGSMYLRGQDDAPVLLQAIDLDVTSHVKYVVTDLEGRTCSTTANHRVPLVWGQNPTYSHQEVNEGGTLYPGWTVIAYVKTPNAFHPLIGEKVPIHLRYWPKGKLLPPAERDYKEMTTKEEAWRLASEVKATADADFAAEYEANPSTGPMWKTTISEIPVKKGGAYRVHAQRWHNGANEHHPTFPNHRYPWTNDPITATRAVFRGTKEEARDHLALIAADLSMHTGDVFEIDAAELWARMEKEFRAKEKGCPHRVSLAVASDSVQSIPAGTPHGHRVLFDVAHQANYAALTKLCWDNRDRYAEHLYGDQAELKTMLNIEQYPYFVVSEASSGRGYWYHEIDAYSVPSRRHVDVVYMLHNPLIAHDCDTIDYGSMDKDADGNRCETSRCLEEMWSTLGIDVMQTRIMFTELNPVCSKTGAVDSTEDIWTPVCAASMRCALEIGTASIAAFGAANAVRWRDVANLVPGATEVDIGDDFVSLKYKERPVRVFLGHHPSAFSPDSRASCLRALASAHNWFDGKAYETHRLYGSNELGIRSVPIKSVVKHIIGAEPEPEDEEAVKKSKKKSEASSSSSADEIVRPKFDANAGPVVVVESEANEVFRFVNIAVDGNHRFQLANGIVTRNSDVRMHGVGKYSWPDGIVYLGEWVLGLQTGLGFKWSGLGTRPQFGRWLDNKLVQSLWVSPAVLAKMPGWTVEEFKAELEGKWAEMARTSAMATAKVPRPLTAASSSTTTAGGAKKANGTVSAPCTCTCKSKPCTCGCACDRCASSRVRASSSSSSSSGACCTHPASVTSPADEWNADVADLIVKLRATMEPHHFFQKAQQQQHAQMYAHQQQTTAAR